MFHIDLPKYLHYSLRFHLSNRLACLHLYSVIARRSLQDSWLWIIKVPRFVWLRPWVSVALCGFRVRRPFSYSIVSTDRVFRYRRSSDSIQAFSFASLPSPSLLSLNTNQDQHCTFEQSSITAGRKLSTPLPSRASVSFMPGMQHRHNQEPHRCLHMQL